MPMDTKTRFENKVRFEQLNINQTIKVKTAYAQTIAVKLAQKKQLENEKEKVVEIKPNHLAFVSAFPLRQFIQETFSILEPGMSYKDNWHIDIISEMLTSATTGDIRKILINLPRRGMKSTLVAIMWFCWAWTFLPHTRWSYASFNEGFAIRDNKKCREIIRSAYYQQRFGDVFKIGRYQIDKKNKFENNKGGTRTCFGVRKGTGEGADFIGCFPKGELIKTQDGYLPIDEIVEKKMELIIPSFNTKTNQVELKPIIGWSINPPNEIIEVTFSDGHKLKCTPDHRLWTSNRGWIEAQDLLSTDMLPRLPISDISNSLRVNLKFSSQTSIAFAGLEDRLNGFFRKFSISNIDSFAFLGSGIGSNRRPVHTAPNLIDSVRTQSVSFSGLFSRFVTFANFNSNCFSDFGSRSIFIAWESSMLFSIANILTSSSIFQISQMVIRWIAVLMSYLLTFWTFANKGTHDLLMHKEMCVMTVSQSIKSCISFAWRSFKNLFFDSKNPLSFSQESAKLTSDSTEIRDAIIPLESNYVFPLFIKHIGFSPRTYCLTIKDTHTFFATSKVGGDRIVANCDDPHEISESESEKIVDTTIKWFFETYSQNVRDPLTAVRFIMHQRVDEDDLTGHILARELGYEHLMIPMYFEDDHPHKNSVSKPLRLGKVSALEVADNSTLKIGDEKLYVDPRDTEAPNFDNHWYQEFYKKSFLGRGLKSEGEGQLYWINRFTPEEVEDTKKNLGSYGISAQLQQRPIKRGGNFFNSANFLVNDRPLELSQIDLNGLIYCRFWDKAGTQDGGHWTVGLLAARTRTRPYQMYIIDVIRKQISYHPRMELILKTAENDFLDFVQSKDETELSIGIEGEKNSSAKDISAIEREMLLGYDVYIDYPQGKKASRAKPVNQAAESGKIKLIAGNWNADFLREIEKFKPEKERQQDDQVDALSGAFRRLVFGIITQVRSTSGAN